MTLAGGDPQVTAAGSETVPVPLDETAAPAQETAAPTEPGVDWKARAEALEKQVGDFRANEISRVQAAERDRMLKGTFDSVALIAESLEELAPGIKAKLDALKTRVTQEGTTAEFLSRQQQVGLEVVAMAKELGFDDVDEETGLDAAKHPEFQVALNYWNQATASDSQVTPLQRSHLLERALSEAHIAARKIEKARNTKTQQDNTKLTKAAVDDAVKKALERVGAKDLDSGRDAGGGGDQSWRSLSPEAKLALGLKQQRERAAAS